MSTGPPTSTSFLVRNHEGARPTCASDIPKRAALDATTKSQCSASSLPPAMAGPWTTATTGSGHVSTRWNSVSTFWSLPRPPRRSRPEAEHPALARMTATRSASPGPGSGSKPPPGRVSISASMALPFSGRVSVTVRTGPEMSTRILSVMAAHPTVRHRGGARRTADQGGDLVTVTQPTTEPQSFTIDIPQAELDDLRARLAQHPLAGRPGQPRRPLRRRPGVDGGPRRLLGRQSSTGGRSRPR